MNHTEHVIEVKNVTVAQKELLMLDNISLNIDKGEFTAIIGPNGAGKTTLLKVILGLIKPNYGTVKVFGKPVDNLGEDRTKIGYVPQIHNIDLNFPITVFEMVMMGRYGSIGLAKRPRREDKDATMASLEKVGIVELKDRPIARLSGGQRQRAFIARALSNSPELLILDEPTTGVDVATTGSLYTLLRDLKSEGTTVLLVSHDIGVVASYLDTLACLNRSLVAHGKPDEIADTEVMKTMYGCDIAYLHHHDHSSHEGDH